MRINQHVSNIWNLSSFAPVIVCTLCHWYSFCKYQAMSGRWNEKFETLDEVHRLVYICTKSIEVSFLKKVLIVYLTNAIFSFSFELQQHITCLMLCILAHTFHVILTRACKMIFYLIEVHMLINNPSHFLLS